MKAIKMIVPALVLTLAAAGCILVSGQFLIDFELDNFNISTETAVTSQVVDLNTEEDYNDHKEDLKAVADIAVLGTLTNNGGGAIGFEVWMTADETTDFTTSAQVSAGATKLWGPFVVLPGASKTVDWNESAQLFTPAGKALLLNEAKADGKFKVYAIGNSTTYNIDVDNGVLAIVLDFGK
ncbi:MAG TPA: hypothetical protein VFT32_12560 [Candidatus Eisenbacteria bacterium]|nr:hypothetical protein [Candidatus Eisenbacteria bacterium]